MKNKLLSLVFAMVFAMSLVACSSQSDAPEVVTPVEDESEVIVEEEAPSEEVMEEVVEEPVAEPLYDYAEDVAFTIEQYMYVDGIESVDIKTIANFEIIPSADTDFETGEPAYYMYKTENGTELDFNVGPLYEPDDGVNEISTYTNEDGVEIIYQITSISNYLYMPLNEEGMYIRIKVSPVDTENFDIKDYLEITRNCYYIIRETE